MRLIYIKESTFFSKFWGGGRGISCSLSLPNPALADTLVQALTACAHGQPNRCLRMAQERIYLTRVSDNHRILRKRPWELSYHP